jgi:hypothetical protein
MESWVGVTSIRIVTPGVGLTASCLVASHAHVRCLWQLESDSRRRSALFCQRLVLWLPWAHARCILNLVSVAMIGIATFGIVSQRLVLWLPSANVLCIESWVGVATTGGDLPASCLVASEGSCTLYIESWVGVATTGVATFCVDLRESCLVPSLSSCKLYMESFVGVSTLGVGCECRVVWRLDAPLGLIWNWSRRCYSRCHDPQCRFDNVS